MSRRNSREGKARRRAERAAKPQRVADPAAFREIFPAYLESDEAYLYHILAAPEAELTDAQRQLRREVLAHHPGGAL